MKTPHALLASGLLLAACGLRPTLPTLTPRSAEITSIATTGLGLRVHLLANNPNAYGLTVQSIRTRVTLASHDLGESQVATTFTLPSHRDVPLDTDVHVPWNDLPGILLASALNENVPYHLDGTVRVGGERIHLDVPFQMDSTLPRSLLLNAVGNAVQGAH